jgi:ferredoxin-nitrite reductase
MMGVRVKTESGETVDGYNIVLGGGVDDTQAVAREVWKSIAYTDIPPLMERLLKAYLANRDSAETFSQFTNRHSVEDIHKLAS